ncbi:hypothetical protein BB561_001284 [Smittium simulii]|uniref:Tip elongation aberrant protein 1 n=1 Tax=Smittium simulii TaxID=133385 RepID=A0A2T9YVE9_9FUNG|nr:hypothetical protein BB561_001284 [Smittium simulii]
MQNFFSRSKFSRKSNSSLNESKKNISAKNAPLSTSNLSFNKNSAQLQNNASTTEQIVPQSSINTPYQSLQHKTSTLNADSNTPSPNISNTLPIPPHNRKPLTIKPTNTDLKAQSFLASPHSTPAQVPPKDLPFTPNPEPTPLNSSTKARHSLSQTQQQQAKPQTSSGIWLEKRISGYEVLPRRGLSVSLHSSDVYIFAGRADKKLKNDLVKLDTENFVASLVNPSGYIPEPREGHAAAFIGRTMFVFGGELEDGHCDDCLYAFNIGNEMWYKVPITGNSLLGRKGHTAISVGSSVYIFGGTVDGYYLHDLACFNVRLAATDGPGWKFIETDGKFPLGRAGHTCNYYNDKIYIYGGMCGNVCFNDLWSYSITENKWEQILLRGATPPARYGHASALVDDCIFIMGGRTIDGTAITDFFAYKISTQRWYTFPVQSSKWPHRVDPVLSIHKSKLLLFSGNATPAIDSATINILDTNKIKIMPDPQTNQKQRESTESYSNRRNTIQTPSNKQNTGVAGAPSDLTIPRSSTMDNIGSDSFFIQSRKYSQGSSSMNYSSFQDDPKSPSIYNQSQQKNSFSNSPNLTSINHKSDISNTINGSSLNQSNSLKDSIPHSGETHPELIGKIENQDFKLGEPLQFSPTFNKNDIDNPNTNKSISTNLSNSSDQNNTSSLNKSLPSTNYGYTSKLRSPSTGLNSSLISSSPKFSQSPKSSQSSQNQSLQGIKTTASKSMIKPPSSSSSPFNQSISNQKSEFTNIPPKDFANPFGFKKFSEQSNQNKELPPLSDPSLILPKETTDSDRPYFNKSGLTLDDKKFSSNENFSISNQNQHDDLANIDKQQQTVRNLNQTTAINNDLTDRRLTIQLRNRMSTMNSDSTPYNALGIAPSGENLDRNIDQAERLSDNLEKYNGSYSDIFKNNLESYVMEENSANNKFLNDKSESTALAKKKSSMDGLITSDKKNIMSIHPMHNPELANELNVQNDSNYSMDAIFQKLGSKYGVLDDFQRDSDYNINGPNNDNVCLNTDYDLNDPRNTAKLAGLVIALSKELESTKIQLNGSMKSALNRIYEAERGRRAVLQEAIYLKTKSCALASGNLEMLSKVNAQRTLDLERQLANTINENGSLRNHITETNLSLRRTQERLAEYQNEVESTKQQLQMMEQFYQFSNNSSTFVATPQSPLGTNNSETNGVGFSTDPYDVSSISHAQEILTLRKEIINLNSNEQSLLLDVENALRALNAANDRSDKLQEMLNSTEKENENLRAEILSLSSQLGAEKSNVSKLKSKLEQSEHLFIGLREQVSALNEIKKQAVNGRSNNSREYLVEQPDKASVITNGSNINNTQSNIQTFAKSSIDFNKSDHEKVSSRSDSNIAAGSKISTNAALDSAGNPINDIQNAFISTQKQWSLSRNEVMNLKQVLRESEERKNDIEAQLINKDRELTNAVARLEAFTKLVVDLDTKRKNTEILRNRAKSASSLYFKNSNLSTSSALLNINGGGSRADQIRAGGNRSYSSSEIYSEESNEKSVSDISYKPTVTNDTYITLSHPEDNLSSNSNLLKKPELNSYNNEHSRQHNIEPERIINSDHTSDLETSTIQDNNNLANISLQNNLQKGTNNLINEKNGDNAEELEYAYNDENSLSVMLSTLHQLQQPYTESLN